MSAALQPPPILRINADVLMHILEINADMFTASKDALDTTRFSSQVCRSWRGIILNAPLLWRRIINIDHLERLRSTVWATEIVRRSKDAPLWIQGKSDWLRGHHASHKQRIFFNKIIENNWDRIERLILSGPLLDDIDNLTAALYRPAPKLQVFHSDFSDNWRDLTTDTSHRSTFLFSGHAPMLQQFSASNRKINFNAPWSSNLKSITLGHAYDVGDYLKILTATKNLQYLHIAGTNKDFSHIPHPAVSLPRLKYLKVTLSFDQIIFLFDHLAIPSGCLLDLFTYTYGIDGITLPQILSTLSTASQRYFKSRPPKKINITCEGSEIVIVRENFQDDFRHQDCIFKLLYHPLDKSLDDMPIVSKSLALPEFASVTELKLCYSVIPSVAPDLSFLQCFSSVEILHTDEHLFNLLIISLPYPDARHTIVFPKLRHLIVQAASYIYSEPCTVGAATVAFILSRIKMGHPISVLDLTTCKDYQMDFSAVNRLESVGGLQVIMRPRP